MNMSRKTCILIIMMVAMSLPDWAEIRGSEDKDFFRISFENDTFINTDRGFTHGSKLSWMSHDIRNYRKNPLLRWFSFTNGPGSIHSFSISLGQNIYTPDNIQTPEFIGNDRPYAGYLYLGFGIHSKNTKRQDTFEIDMGIVGRHSFAEQTQKIIHYLFKHEDPLGWKHQLKDEFAFQTIFERKTRIYRASLENEISIELIPHFGGGLGNVYIYANAGYQVRFGWKLPYDFGIDMHRPGGDTNIGINSWGKPNIHVFAALDGQAVYRNIFLDGNTIVDSHHVEKYPFTANIMTGIGIQFNGIYITYTYVYWTKKFKTESRNHQFGVLNISFSF